MKRNPREAACPEHGKHSVKIIDDIAVSFSFCSTFFPHPCKFVCVCMVSLEGKERKIRSEGSSPSSFFKRIQEKKKNFSLWSYSHLLPRVWEWSLAQDRNSAHTC